MDFQKSVYLRNPGVGRVAWRSASVGVPVALAAKQLAISQPTVRSWIRRGLLTAVADRTAELARGRWQEIDMDDRDTLFA